MESSFSRRRSPLWKSGSKSRVNNLSQHLQVLSSMLDTSLTPPYLLAEMLDNLPSGYISSTMGKPSSTQKKIDPITPSTLLNSMPPSISPMTPHLLAFLGGSWMPLLETILPFNTLCIVADATDN